MLKMCLVLTNPHLHHGRRVGPVLEGQSPVPGVVTGWAKGTTGWTGVRGPTTGSTTYSHLHVASVGDRAGVYVLEQPFMTFADTHGLLRKRRLANPWDGHLQRTIEPGSQPYFRAMTRSHVLAECLPK